MAGEKAPARQAVRAGELPVEVVEAAILQVDDDDVIDIRERGPTGAGGERSAGAKPDGNGQGHERRQRDVAEPHLRSTTPASATPRSRDFLHLLDDDREIDAQVGVEGGPGSVAFGCLE